MKVNMFNSVENGIAEIGALEKAAPDSGSMFSAAYPLKMLNDCLRILLDAKPEELPKLQQEMREFLCVETSPLRDFETVRAGVDK